ncbi:MAG TPA: hypothetical protein VMM79_09510 [Longimicrobiales bacterium]|nr:hypothetical protein [Longimicrobiales bacterium]
MTRARLVTAATTTAAVLALSSCGATSGGAGSPAGGERNLLTAEQLSTMHNADAYQAVSRLRPAWLIVRGTGSFQPSSNEGVRVYVDRILQGGVAALRAIAVQTVEQMRFLDGRDATTQFGTNHGSGAILVTTRGRGNSS